MSPVLSYQPIRCPYCGEWIELTVDGSAGELDYVEDCSVCCRPIGVAVRANGDDWVLEVRRDDE